MIALVPGEKRITTAFANLFRGGEAVGGKLYVTNRRLRFESHPFNFQTGPTDLRLDEIRSVSPEDTAGLVPNGMHVELENGDDHDFVVWHRERLIDLIHSVLDKRTKLDAGASRRRGRLPATRRSGTTNSTVQDDTSEKGIT